MERDRRGESRDDECGRRVQDDDVAASVSEELRKGPRGGGRDRDPMFLHVLGAEVGYARQIGTRLKELQVAEEAEVRALRKAILESLKNPNRVEKWPVPYAARRLTWHTLDHAWEMEDKDLSAEDGA